MKLITTVLLTICSSTVFAQAPTVVNFRDGKSYTIKGSSVGTYTELSDGAARKTITTFYHRKDSVITITIKTDWVVEKTMDELRVYSFKVSAIQASSSFGEINAAEADEFIKEKTFELSLSSNEGMDFGYDTYTAWEAVPKKSKWSSLSIKSSNKEAIEKITAEIKALLPKEAE
jgi:hypothetical protein